MSNVIWNFSRKHNVPYNELVEFVHTVQATTRTTPQQQPTCLACGGTGWLGGPSFYAPDEGGVPCPDCNQPQPVQEAPRGGNICLDCANADSWGVPDKRICQDCNMNSQWQPLNKSSKNPIQQTPHAAQPSEQAQPSEMQDTAETLLPHAYLFEKLAMVMPLFQEARDALTAIREDQRIRHGISATLADRMDAAGTFSLDDWMNAQPKPAEQEQQEE